jgi:OmpA-OmpF porin, OOP family
MKTRVTEMIVHATVSALVIIALSILSYSAQAQSTKGAIDHTARMKDDSISHATNVRLTAQAIPLKSSINGPYSELKPALAPDGKRLYFSRFLHPDNTHDEDYEDIWYSEYEEESSSWSDPVRLHGVLNNHGPNFINNVSITGDTVILGNQYHKNGKMRAGLSFSVNEKGQWTQPQNIHIKHDYNMSHQANAFISLKNGVIISSIERAESLGGRDLYVSFWNGHEATEPVNMGDLINSELEESSPFLDADNKTLYFASKGHNGYGGYDIFVTKRLDDTWTNWSEPQNLGPAVNGEMDDEFFTITHCGNYAIFAKQVSVHNIDIFRISVDELFTDGVARRKYTIDEETATALAAL